MTDHIRRISVRDAFAAYGASPPFRVAATSFTVPDTVRVNCRHLAPLFPEVGIVLFELESCLAYGPQDWPEVGPDWPEYHLHLPLGLPWEQAPGQVLDGLEKLLRLTAPLRPRAYVLHPPHTPELLLPLRQRLDSLGIAPSRVLLENIRRDDLTHTWPVARELGFDLCLDVGHMLAYGQTGLPKLEGIDGRVAMVHAYAPGHDGAHTPLPGLSAYSPTAVHTLEHLLGLLRPDGTLTLEVFEEAGLYDSLRWLAARLFHRG